MNSKVSFLCGAAIASLALPACNRKSAPPAAALPEVLVMEAAAREVHISREWIGTLDGSENADIRARVTGYLLKRAYHEGSLVKKGDLLFEIDSRPSEGRARARNSPTKPTNHLAL